MSSERRMHMIIKLLNGQRIAIETIGIVRYEPFAFTKQFSDDKEESC
jgi:hypothetical protein